MLWFAVAFVLFIITRADPRDPDIVWGISGDSTECIPTAICNANSALCDTNCGKCNNAGGTMTDCGSCGTDNTCSTSCTTCTTCKNAKPGIKQQACSWVSPIECQNVNNNVCNGEPGAKAEQDVVALVGTLQWTNNDDNTLTFGDTTTVATEQNGYIGRIMSVHDRPIFTEIFSITNDRGLLCSIKIVGNKENTNEDGKIYLVSWTLGQAGYRTNGVNRQVWLRDRTNQGNPIADSLCPFAPTAPAPNCPYDALPNNPQMNFFERVSLDGIVFVARGRGGGTDTSGSSNVLSLAEEEDTSVIDKDTDDNGDDSFMDMIKSPVWLVVLLFISFAVMGIFIAITLKCIQYCCDRKSRNIPYKKTPNDKESINEIKVIPCDGTEVEQEQM